MAHLRKGSYGNYYGSYFNESEPLTTTQQQINAKYIFLYLSDKGWTKNAIAGMLGNFQAESTINSGRWQNDSVGSYSLGYGLAQWTPVTKYTDWCSEQGYSDPSEMDNNLARIIYELENGLQYYKNKYPLTFREFTKSTESAGYLAKAWLLDYERPEDQSTSVQNYRLQLAESWYSYLSNLSTNSEVIDKACEWAVGIANDDTHGYDQTNRWGLDYDCSSLVIQAYEQAGCPVKTNGATYTGNMKSVFTDCGFISIPYTVGMELIKGDVLWKTGHTELYIGNNQNVGAHINEFGEVTGGQTGDQTGHEISVTDAPNGDWEIVLRLTTSPDVPDTPERPHINYSSLSKLLLFAVASDDL